MPAVPTVSVVVPAHDAAPYLPDLLTSLERNAEVDAQVVVVDDGSRDDTPLVLAEFAERLAWLDVITHLTPTGPGAARNAGLAAAKGEYIVYLDGDDWIGPGYLAGLVTAIDRLGCDFVRVDHVQVRGSQRTPHLAPEMRRDVVLDPTSGILPLSRRTPVDYCYPWAGIYRRALGDLLRFDTAVHTAEDRPWAWRLHREAESYAVSTVPGLFYRREVTTSLTAVGDERQLQFIDAFAIIKNYVRDEPAYLGKALRQFFSVLIFQIEREEERLSPALRQQLRRRATAFLADVDPDVLIDAVPADHRASLLQSMLPPAARNPWRVAS